MVILEWYLFNKGFIIEFWFCCLVKLIDFLVYVVIVKYINIKILKIWFLVDLKILVIGIIFFYVL